MPVTHDNDVSRVNGTVYHLTREVLEDVAWVGRLEGELALGRKAISWPERDAAKLGLAFFLARHDRPAMTRAGRPGIHRARPTART